MKEIVEMSAEERREFEAYRLEKEKKRKEEERKAQRLQYGEMVDKEVAEAMVDLMAVSNAMAVVKNGIYCTFETIIDLKRELMGLSIDAQRSHTFTTSDGKYRLTLGVNTIDGYRDTVEDGIAMVKEYIEGLAKDEQTRALVNAVLRLLSRDQNGTIKASRVLQLRKMADDSGDDRFIEGVRIIEESYQPTVTKRYIRAEYRNKLGAWVYVPLSMTDVDNPIVTNDDKTDSDDGER